MLMREQIIFELKSELKYQAQGEHETKELILKAPIAKHERYVRPIQQLITQALLSVESKLSHRTPPEKEEEDPSKEASLEEKGTTFLNILQGGSENYMESLEKFYSLFCDGICCITTPSGEISLTRDLLKDIPFLEKDRMIGVYIANFIMP